MRVEQLPVGQIAALLAGDGLRIRFGPVNVRLQTGCAWLVEPLRSQYACHELAPDEIAEFHLRLDQSRLGRSVLVRLDGEAPFPPVARGQALLHLEQLICWGIATRVNHLLILRAAIVARDDHAILIPHSKGTAWAADLCAALVFSGYRLVASVLGLLEPERGLLMPLPGLLELSHSTAAAIDKVLSRAMQPVPADLQFANFGRITCLRPPADSVRQSADPVGVRTIIVPRCDVSAKPALEPLAISQAFMSLAGNSANYDTLGAIAFTALNRLLHASQCFGLVYPDYPAALALLGRHANEI